MSVEKREKIRNAFRSFDTKDTGLISCSLFKIILTRFGKKVNEKQADALIREANAKVGNGENMLDIEKLIDLMLSK